jgi:predicted MFS family arabinose efflux permease
MLNQQQKRLIFLLTAIQLTHVLDFVIMMPLGPMLMRSLSITPGEFSSLVSIYNISAGIFGLVFGLWIDRFERRNLILMTFVGFILSTFACGVAHSFTFLFLARLSAGLFGGLVNALVFAVIGDEVEPAHRGEATGIVMSAFSIASVLGVPLGLRIATSYNWEMSFYFIGAVSCAVLIFSYLWLPKRKIVGKSFVPLKDVLGQYKSLLKKSESANGLILIALVSFSSFLIIPMISPFAVRNLFVPENHLQYIYFFGGILTLVTSYLTGILTDKKGPGVVYITASLLSLIPILSYTHMGPAPFFVLLLLTSTFMALMSGRFVPTMTLLNNLAHTKDRGAYLSLVNAVRTLSVALAAWTCGLLVSINGAGQLEGYGSCGYISLFLVLVSIYLLRKKLPTSFLKS